MCEGEKLNDFATFLSYICYRQGIISSYKNAKCRE
jgi:hypothetical protein